MLEMTNDIFLEELYSRVILPRYSNYLDLNDIIWIDHGKVDLDAWAHTFKSNSIEYVLLYEDFPINTYLDDGLTHELLKCGDETSIQLKFKDNYKQLENITGWYTLFREKKG
jgi:hypothetical protein